MLDMQKVCRNIRCIWPDGFRHNVINFCAFGCVKASKIDDRKFMRIINTHKLAKPAVDRFIESFHASQMRKNLRRCV